MRDDEVDRLFANPELLVPSAAFTASVMKAVGCEAARPAPIPFPWRRIAPAVVILAALWIAATMYGGSQGPIAAAPQVMFGVEHEIGVALDILSSARARSIALALAATLAAAHLSAHLVRERS